MSEDAATYDAKCEDALPMGVAMSPPSAVTWDEADAIDAAAEQAHEAAELFSRYMSITSAIMARPEMDAAERARLVQDAAAGFAQRITAQREAEDTRAVRPGRLARLLGAKVTNSEGLGPDDYAVVGDPDKPSTWQLRIDDAEHISGAIQALSPAGFRGQQVRLDSGTRTGAIRKIRAAINKLPDDARGNLPDRLDALKSIDEPSLPSQIVLLPGDEPGTYSRVAMWASNNFRDRAGEIFSADAMRAAVDRFNARAGVKGAANIWHVGHPKWGFAPEQRGISDWAHLEHAAYADGFLFVEGPVTDQRAAAYIAEWAKSTELGTSIEYSYRPDSLAEGGVYSDYDFDRVTVCPAAYAVNPFNPVMTGTRGNDMPFENEQIRSAIEAIWGADFVREQEEAARKQLAENSARGMDSKAIDISLPPAVIRFVVDEAKSDDVSVADATPATTVADGGATTGEATEAPQWFRDYVAAQDARQAERDAEIKALREAQETSTGAAGILGRSVQYGGADDTKARAIAELHATGKAGGVLGEDWGIVNDIANDLFGGSKAQTPAGA